MKADDFKACGSTQNLNLVVEPDGDHEIWYEDFMILGCGKDFEEARRKAIDGVCDTLKQLTAATPPDDITNTEASQRVTLPPKDVAGEPPEGPVRDGNKPLMGNRTANECHPRQVTGGNTFGT